MRSSRGWRPPDRAAAVKGKFRREVFRSCSSVCYFGTVFASSPAQSSAQQQSRPSRDKGVCKLSAEEVLIEKMSAARDLTSLPSFPLNVRVGGFVLRRQCHLEK